MISLIIPPKDQISRVSKMLADEFGTASNIKSRVNRLSVLGAITSVQHRLKLYTKGNYISNFLWKILVQLARNHSYNTKAYIQTSIIIITYSYNEYLLHIQSYVGSFTFGDYTSLDNLCIYVSINFSASKWPGNLLWNYCNGGREREKSQHRF